MSSLPKKIRVLIVDDSAIVRQVLTRQLARDASIEVVGTAPDPYVAREMIVAKEPDVLTLDIEMPRMDGLTFLTKLMRHKPIPVVVVSSLTPKGSALALKALDLGAVEVVCKPGAAYTLGDLGEEIVDKVKGAAYARMGQLAPSSVPTLAVPSLPDLPGNQLLAIGASTGGTLAIERILRTLPAETPATVIAQHMPPNFTRAFAERLNGLCALEVREAENGMPLAPGRAVIAPGGRHLLLRRRNGVYEAVVKDGPRVHRQKPAVDVLFRSVAKTAGPHGVGVVLTGMGRDGAKGLLSMREAGASTMAQDEASCVVFGMPRMAIEVGGAEDVVSLQEIPRWIVRTFHRRIRDSAGLSDRRIADAETRWMGDDKEDMKER